MIPIASSSEVRALLALHETKRPDALVALHPNATRAVRNTFTRWNDTKSHLHTLLGMAIDKEKNGWKPVIGGEEPIIWTDGKGNFISLQFANQSKKTEKTALPSIRI